MKMRFCDVVVFVASIAVFVAALAVYYGWFPFITSLTSLWWFV